ncbi:Y-family DNA polymerase [Flavihumibacter petaseus]|uniref:ImuB protein n=1 Tax=Flavihumibacter petaseus NBRC 106054 TaxID=1220578 RepID=A0A0E9N034_9BACT|nr:DNA polymerase Y family protein [Flavihumibacter petaseus]GAO43199.1 ImuB protein [Flavihumibacter petaseus NBRC 106054]
MAKRFVSIWLPHLLTDYFSIREQSLIGQPLVLSYKSHGRMLVEAANAEARSQGAYPGMILADARALIPGLEVRNSIPDLAGQVLSRMASWCIRFTPVAGIDLPEGILLDASGCSHLWGGDEPYLQEIIHRINEKGFHVAAAMADTIGAAWAKARYGQPAVAATGLEILPPETHQQRLLDLPAIALRIDNTLWEKLQQLGLYKVRELVAIPRATLRRRFGTGILERLDQAFGKIKETLTAIEPVQQFSARVNCFDPVITATGITIALEKLLRELCEQLRLAGKGIRKAVFKGYRTDGKLVEVFIQTQQPTLRQHHLLQLFGLKIPSWNPDPGIELFVLEAVVTDDLQPHQEQLWTLKNAWEEEVLTEWIDKVSNRIGEKAIRRYLPAAHYWPERAFTTAPVSHPLPFAWPDHKLRPILMLPHPEPIEVTAPIPDYPPMLFRYKGKLHKITRADGPERIEQEWWLSQGQHRDYYRVENEAGERFWLFRSGHYDPEKTYRWFLHGFFA